MKRMNRLRAIARPYAKGVSMFLLLSSDARNKSNASRASAGSLAVLESGHADSDAPGARARTARETDHHGGQGTSRGRGLAGGDDPAASRADRVQPAGALQPLQGHGR